MNSREVSIALFEVLQNGEKKLVKKVFEIELLLKPLVFNMSNLAYSPGLENILLGDY